MMNYISDFNPQRIELSCDVPLYIMSDIHANLPALKAVLAEIPAEATILCVGDIVGYYTEPNESCELLKKRHVHCIVGNHDLYVTEALPYDMKRDSLYRTTWTRNILTKENLDWLQQLPSSIMVNVTGYDSKIKTVLAHHGDLKDPEKYIYPDTEFDFSVLGEQTLCVLGNTHHPMIRQVGSSYLLNPGSIGQPRDWNPCASYAVVNLKSAHIEIHRVRYDVSAYQDNLRLNALDEKAIDILSRVK